MTVAKCDKRKYSETYRGHTNKSYKNLTNAEKKQIEFLGMIHRLSNKARILNDLRIIRNAFLSNCAYHTKNIELQIKKLESLNVPKEELEVLSGSYDLSANLGKSLINDLKKVIDYAKKNDS